MNETAYRAEQIKALHAVQTGVFEPNSVITGMRLDDGSYHVLSRFADSIWFLPDSLFPAGIADYHKKLKFSRVPSEFRETMRSFMARYILVGIEGRRRLRGISIRCFFSDAACFLDWLTVQRIDRFSAVTPLTCQQYVDFCKELKGRTGQRLASATLMHRFLAVETLYNLSLQSADPMRYPWPDSSATHLAGITGQGHYRCQEAKTDIIPDAILGPLFRSAVEWLERADEIINIRDQIDDWKVQGRSWGFIDKRLERLGWTRREVGKAQRNLQSACMCVILITTGIRVSELCSLENNCWYTIYDDQGEPFYWMQGASTKTGVGECEWLIDDISCRAIDVAERCAKPMLDELTMCISDLRTDNPRDPEIKRLSAHSDRLFLGVTSRKRNRIETLSGRTILKRLNSFAAQCRLDWHFTPHQFRRTFAVYAAHSALGDLRYLRDHFKHWGLDMTILYAMNRKQDAELYDEVALEAHNIKLDLLEHWLEPDSIITGGAADPIRTFRTQNGALVTKKDRSEMAKTISPLVCLRATGVAWCTADTGGCNGGQGTEKTRCGDCGNAVIDMSRKPIWEGIYAQQLELRALSDIGPGGAERVERDIERCKRVLKELGATDEDLADVAI